MSRLALFCAGLLMLGSLSGCCMHGGYPYGAGYGGGYGGPCSNGACGAYGPGYPSAGLYGQGAPMTAWGTPAQTAYSPGFPQTTTAWAPVDTLSTY